MKESAGVGIIGADIDRDILFEEDRIRTFYIDQTDPSAIAEFWNQVGLSEFDVIVDDGLHTFEAACCLFENSISKLRQDGIYIIEDVAAEDMSSFKDYFADKPFVVDYVNLFRPNVGLRNNNLVVVRRSERRALLQ